MHKMAGKAGARGWGHIRQLPSGNWQASYIGPDRRRHTAPMTYTNSRAGKVRAQKWLGDERELMETGTWTPPVQRAAAGHELLVPEILLSVLEPSRLDA